MNIQALKHLPSWVLAAALLVLPHAAHAEEPPSLSLELYSNLDATMYIYLWLDGAGNGTAGMPLVQGRPLAPGGGSIHQSNLSCAAAGDCGQGLVEVRDGHGNVVCKGWIGPAGGSVTLNMGMLRRTGGATGYAICGLGGTAVREVEIPSAPYRK